MDWTPASRTKCYRCWTRCVCSRLRDDDCLISRSYIESSSSIISHLIVSGRFHVVLCSEWVFHQWTQSLHSFSALRLPQTSQMHQLTSKFRVIHSVYNRIEFHSFQSLKYAAVTNTMTKLFVCSFWVDVGADIMWRGRNGGCRQLLQGQRFILPRVLIKG